MAPQSTDSLLDGSKWNDEDIVITGISGRFPECDSVQEFQEKLLAGINLISDDPRRWQNGLHGSLATYGMLKDLTRFDAEFFNISPKQADRMDPQVRNLLEVVYEAIVDAGLHPDDLSETKTGVVVGVASSETHYKWCQMPDRINGYEYTGCTRTMFANRVSYKFNLKGPSYTIDTASSTTMVAFQQAYDMIKDGLCDACFVCGTDLVMNPSVCLMFQCLNMLSPEGKCKAFDASGDGYVRSEAAIAVLFQKAKNAKRIYAKVLAAGSNCDGYKDDGITYPSGPQQIALFRRVAEIAGINPAGIDFMEAHGSATRVGDPQEMNAVTEVFVKGRSTPLKTGSIKSNMGHGEPASALSAVIKVCVAMECGIIPPNLHYNIPNPDIPALHDGRLQVITKPTPWNGGVVAVNSFGVGGANGHALLLSNKKPKQITSTDGGDRLARLVCVSGTTSSAVKTFLNKIDALPRDPEMFGLIYNIHRKNIKGHPYRGYLLLDGHDGITVNDEKLITTPTTFCLILPGIESNLRHIESDIIDLEIFQKSLDKCQKILNSIDKSINLRNIVFDGRKSPVDTLSFVLAITSLQVCYIDALNYLGVKTDYIVGFNVGEIAAGYADECYTIEQTLLIAYHVGSLLNSVPRQNVAALLIAKPKDTDKYELPSDLAVIADISLSDGYTIVWGAKDSIRNFSEHLTSKNIRSVVRDIDGQMPIPKLLSASVNSKNDNCERLIGKILVETGKPTSKWLTYGYYDRSKNNSVASHLVRSISSTLVLQEVLNNTFPSRTVTTTFLAVDSGNWLENNFKLSSTVRRSSSTSFIQTNNNAKNFLISLGKLYVNGFQPQLQNLYPPVKYPVSHGTPKIQSMIEWDHSRKWNVVSFAAKDPSVTGEVKIVVYFDREEFGYISGNKLHGQPVFPKSFYLMLIWKALSRLQTKPISDISLVIENLCFVRETIITGTDTPFYINILGSCGKFEIWEGDGVVCYGTVKMTDETDIAKEYLSKTEATVEGVPSELSISVSKADIYNMLHVLGYDYSDKLQTIRTYNYRAGSCTIEWTGNWAVYLESMLQLFLLDSVGFALNQYTLAYVKKIVISPKLPSENFDAISDSAVIIRNRKLDVITGNGVEIHGIQIKQQPSSKLPDINICSEYYEFVQFFTVSKVKSASSKEIGLRIAIENWLGSDNLKICEVAPFRPQESALSPVIRSAYPGIQMDITVYTREPPVNSSEDLDNHHLKYVYGDFSDLPNNGAYHVIVCSHVVSNPLVLANLAGSLSSEGGCLLTEEYVDLINDDVIGGLRVLSVLPSVDNGKCFVILKKISAAGSEKEVIQISKEKYWIQKINEILAEGQKKDVLLVANSCCGSIAPFEILNYVKYIRRKTRNIRLLIVDEDEWDYDSHAQFFEEQLGNMYPVNVLQKNGILGCYLPHEISQQVTVPCDSAYFGIRRHDSSVIGYVQKPSKRDLNKVLPNRICKVHYAAINEEDAIAISASETTRVFDNVNEVSVEVGMEFSGVDMNNNQIFGLVRNGALATDVTTSEYLTWNIPPAWSFEQATTVPLAYSLAYYALSVVEELDKSLCNILIFGLNAVSLAILNLCDDHRAINWFIVVETEVERSYVNKLFPVVGKNRVHLYNNGNFYADILKLTDWKGVEVVFSADEIDSGRIRNLLNAISENGTFIYRENRLPMDNLLGSAGNMKCLTFQPISLQCLFGDRSSIPALKFISDSIAQGLKSGEIKPLEFVSFDSDRVTDAFRGVTQRQPIKTLIRIRNNDSNNNRSPEEVTDIFSATPKMYFKADSLYVVLLDRVSNYGLYVTDWMTTRGVKHLFVVSTSGNENLKNFFVNSWRKKNVRVQVHNVENFSTDECERLIQLAAEFCPIIGGIIDTTALNVFGEAFDLNEVDLNLLLESTEKISLVNNMDKAVRKLCPDLEHFVVFGAATDFGSKGSVVSYANGLLEKIIAERKRLNYPATIINWSVIDEDLQQTYEVALEDNNFQPLPVTSSIRMLDKFLQLPHSLISCYSVREKSGDTSKSKVDNILEGVAKFLGIKDPKSVRPTITLLELGLDSLIGTDIQHFLEENCQLVFDTQEIRKQTFESLRKIIDDQK